MEFQTILFEVRNQIAFVTFNRPESMNAISRQMARELVEACKQIEDDSALRVAIFTGAGERAFSAGMDLKERAETAFSPIDRRNQKISPTIHTQSRAIAAMTKPTIAAIRGYCVGGGLEMALACDMRVAAEDAKLGLTEVRRGLIPGAGGTQRLPRAVGVAKALEICLTGDNVTGSEALAIGFGEYRRAGGRRDQSCRGSGEQNSKRRADVGGFHKGSDQEGNGVAVGRRIAIGSRSFRHDRDHRRQQGRPARLCRETRAGVEREMKNFGFASAGPLLDFGLGD